MTSFLQYGNVRLRAVEPADIDFIVGCENATELWEVSGATAPMSRRIVEEYVERYSADIFRDGQLRLMIADAASGRTVGIIDLFDFAPFEGRAAVGIIVDSGCRRNGYAHHALCALIAYARDYMGMHQLYAHVPKGNEASRALFAKAGFTETGRLKDWQKVGCQYRTVTVLQKLL
ncbi:MAG: GNAT family N-acetyltransferase [Muribaculaceae bacterium]